MALGVLAAMMPPAGYYPAVHLSTESFRTLRIITFDNKFLVLKVPPIRSRWLWFGGWMVNRRCKTAHLWDVHVYPHIQEQEFPSLGIDSVLGDSPGMLAAVCTKVLPWRPSWLLFAMGHLWDKMLKGRIKQVKHGRSKSEKLVGTWSLFLLWCSFKTYS